MKTFLGLILTFLACFAAAFAIGTLLACDAVAPPDWAVALRGDPTPPEALVLVDVGGKPIDRAAFDAIVADCLSPKDTPLTVTLSWYQPDSADPDRVLGLGFSMMASEAVWQCFDDGFVKRGAEPL